MKKPNRFNDLFGVKTTPPPTRKPNTDEQGRELDQEWRFDKRGCDEFYRVMSSMGYQREADGEEWVWRKPTTTPSRTEQTLQRLAERGNSAAAVKKK